MGCRSVVIVAAFETEQHARRFSEDKRLTEHLAQMRPLIESSWRAPTKPIMRWAKSSATSFGGGRAERRDDMAISATIAGFVASIDAAKLPPELVARTRLLVLDLVGNAVRARREAESTPPLIAAAEALGLCAGKARVFADTQGYAPA